MVFLDGRIFTAGVSKLRPDSPAEFYVRAGATAEATQTPAWKQLQQAVEETAEERFGALTFRQMLENGTFRSPIRYDVAGKGWSPGIVKFLNMRAKEENPPIVFDRDALPIMNQAELYPGCIIRISCRVYAYGGKGTNYGAGVSFGLENIQKLEDGPRLKNARADGSEFGRLGDDEDDPFK